MRCCLKSLIQGMILGVILIAVAVVAFYFYAYPKLDSILGDAVRREYMLPPSANIKFKHGTLVDTYQGKLQSFTVDAKEAKLEGLLINDVHLVATGIQFDMPRTFITGEAELRKVDHARLRFRVSEDALAQRWGDELTSRGLKDIDVDLRDKEIAVSGKLDLKLTQVPVSARGVFEVDGSNKIRMKVNQLSFGDTILPLGGFKDLFSKSIRTPVLDLGELQMGVNVKRLEPHSGYLYVEAESDRPGDLADALHKSVESKPVPDQATPNAAGKSSSDADKLGDTVKDAAKDLKKLGGKLKKIL